MTLDEISRTLTEVRTDKGGGRIGDHDYLVRYEVYTGPIKDKVKNVLELGIEHGGSLILWTRYFVNATINAIELYQDPIDMSLRFVDKSRVTIHKGDYTDLSFMDSIMPAIGNSIDIIVDDGDHSKASQICALMYLGKYLSMDGYYFLEDTNINNIPAILEASKSSDLEFIDDYCNIKYLPNNPNEYHFLVFRRKR